MLRRHSLVFLLIASLLASAVTAAAQGPQEKVDLQAIEKIKEEGMKRSQIMDILSYMTDVHGPRLTNSPNLKAAQEWAVKKLTEMGISNARLESWGPFGRGWTLEGFTANIIKPTFSPLIAYPKAWSPSTNGVVRGAVVHMDVKTEADLEKYRGKLKGAIVLTDPAREVKAHWEAKARRATDESLLQMANAEPPAATRGDGPRFELTEEQKAAQALNAKKWELIYAEGAAVTLEPTARNGDGGIVFVGSATIPQPPDTPRERRRSPWAKDAGVVIPQIVVTPEHYNRIIRMAARGVAVQMEVSVTSRFQEQDLMGYNVIAEIPGTDLKDEVVMVGAHYDSWHAGTGATDNAAGSAVAMEALRIIQASGLKPRRTIRIGLWSGEEQGLLGSRAYVGQHFGKRIDTRAGGGQQASQEPAQFEIKPAHEKFSGYFNLDNGTGKIRGVYMQGNEAMRPIFRAWLAPFKEMGATTLTISNTGGTDHLAFDAVGLPGFQFIQDPVEYGTRTHHTNMDVYDRIQEDDMKQAATVMAAFVYNAATRAGKLPRKPLPGQPVAQSGQ
ncbi:MAG TPA: M20/M25/M40 family metallo-hydrolase [Blastocatellia bacterium]|nr:M20/M25/M40 family metallo-hydrolase [Blastocatellia bacterium]